MFNDLLPDFLANGVASRVILLVEDHSETRQLMAAFLRNAGVQIIEARDGVDALAAIATRMPHLVLTDLRMPNMDGIILSRCLKSTPAYRHIPIVLLSTTLPTNKSLHPEVSLFIQKPCALSTLLETLEPLWKPAAG